MSTAKFASLHSGLIVRKGQAAPSPTVAAQGLAPVAAHPAKPRPAIPAAVCGPATPQVEASNSAKPARIKAITLRLDQAHYHRAQLAAARQGRTAQDVLREAVERHLHYLGAEVFPHCGCIRGEAGCNR